MDDALSELHTFGDTLIPRRLILRVVVCGAIFDVVSLFVAAIAGVAIGWDSSSARIVIIVIIVVVSTAVVPMLERPPITIIV